MDETGEGVAWLAILCSRGNLCLVEQCVLVQVLRDDACGQRVAMSNAHGRRPHLLDWDDAAASARAQVLASRTPALVLQRKAFSSRSRARKRDASIEADGWKRCNARLW